MDFFSIVFICAAVVAVVGIITYGTWRILTDRVFMEFVLELRNSEPDEEARSRLRLAELEKHVDKLKR